MCYILNYSIKMDYLHRVTLIEFSISFTLNIKAIPPGNMYYYLLALRTCFGVLIQKMITPFYIFLVSSEQKHPSVLLDLYLLLESLMSYVESS